LPSIVIQVEHFYREAAVHSKLALHNHPHICGMYGVCVTPPSMALVLKQYHGSLHQLLHSARYHRLSWLDKIQICVDCASALVFVHQNGYLHNDIKSQNFLVQSETDLTCLLTDFELTTPFGEQNSRVCDIVNYASCETIAGSELTETSDCYSLAMVIYEVATGEIPFRDPVHREDERAADIIHGTERPIIPESMKADGMLQGLCSLIQDAWSTDAAARPSSNRMLQRLQSLYYEVHVASTKIAASETSRVDTAASIM
jgi:serine/threonine protein kinase